MSSAFKGTYHQHHYNHYCHPARLIQETRTGDTPELLHVADAFCDITGSTKWEADNDVTGSMGPGKPTETAAYKLHLVAGHTSKYR